MKLSKIAFKKIVSGEKIIESRLFDKKRRQINIGDEINFVQKDNPCLKVYRKVTALHRYTTFKELFSDFPASYFGRKSKELLLKEIRQLYSLKEEKKLGVIGIKIEKIKNPKH